MIRLSLKLGTEVVELEQADDTVKTYTLRELTGEERDTYLTGVFKRMKFSPAGKSTGLSSFEGLQAMLLTLCLRDDAGELAKKADIQAYPASTQNQLFELAQKMNGLDVVAEEEAKND